MATVTDTQDAPGYTSALSVVHEGAVYLLGSRNAAGTWNLSHADVENALASVGFVRLVRGRVYSLDATIDASSSANATLDGNGATITAGWAPAVGLADDPTNCLIRFAGATSTAKINTTTKTAGGAAQYQQQVDAAGAGFLDVVAAGSIVVGDWVIVEGANGGTGTQYPHEDELINSGADVLAELCKVTAIVANRLSVTTKLLQTHSDGVPVLGVTPAVGLRIMNLTLSAAGGSIACGVYCSRAIGVRLDEVTVTGFSRYAIEFDRGCMTCIVSNALEDGECNGFVKLHSTHLSTVRGARTTPTGARVHANGKPRASIALMGRPVKSSAVQCRVVNRNVAYEVGGARSCTFDVEAFDCYPAEIIARNAAEYPTPRGSGLLVDGLHAGWSFDCDFKARLSCCRGSAAGQGAFTLFDVQNSRADIVMDQNSPYHTANPDGYWDGGGNIADNQRFDLKMTVHGTSYALLVQGSLNATTSIDFQGFALPLAGGSYADIGIQLSTNSYPRFQRCTILGFQRPFIFDTGSGAPDAAIRFRNLYMDTPTSSPIEYDEAWIAYLGLTTPVIGDVVNYGDNGSGQPQVTAPISAVGIKVVIAYPNTGQNSWGIVAPLYRGIRCKASCNGAIVVGDVLEGNATRKAVTNSLSTNPIGVAMSANASGNGTVMVG